MEQTNSIESKGFQAHIYLSGNVKSRGWEYVTRSKLTTALAEENPTWRIAERAHDRGHHPAPKQLTLEFGLTELFHSLANWWVEDTQHMSNLIKASHHPAYQQIIGMGKAMPRVIVPLILHELRQRPDHWFWALHEITNQDPAPVEADFDIARNAWLTWGKQNYYL